jgi:hypothetical protein
MCQETIEIKKANAITAYKNADKSGKKLIADLVGEKNLITDIRERVKTFEDACEVNGEDADSLIDKWARSGDSVDEIANKKLKRIAKALQQGWKADYSDGSQRKWYPWFVWERKGFRFSDSHCAYGRANTTVGPRLCFATEELARYFGEQFIEIHNEHLS